MNKMREEFEEYCAKEELGMTGSDCTGEYYNPVIEMLWHCWKASRSAQCVELPEIFEACHYEDPEHLVMCNQGVVCALRAAGVKFK